MADDTISTAVESFSLPIEHFITALGQGIAEAQRALDENSIKTQQDIDSDPTLSSYGLQATWYQFPKVDLQLKLAVTVSQQQSSSPPPSPAPAGTPAPASAISSTALRAASLVSLVAQPVSASYQTQFNYDASAASTLTLSIVPVPGPQAADRITVPPRMKRDGVQKAALASGAKFQLDGQGQPLSNLRFDVNFNAASRTWYVLQYDPSNPPSNPVAVAVDDATGKAWVITKS